MGENLYYLIEIVIFSSIALVFTFAPQYIFKAIKLKIIEEKGGIIRVAVVVVAVLNVIMNFNQLLQ